MAMTFDTDVTVNNTRILKADTINIPITSGGSTYGAGTSGQVIKTNGTTVYWGTDEGATDTKVQQSAVISSSGEFPLIHAYNTGTAKVTNVVYKASATINPSTGQITMKGKPVLYGEYSESSAPSSPVSGQIWFKKATMTIEETKPLVVTTGTVSSLPTTITNSSITSDMEVIKSELSNPNAQSGDIVVTFTDGSATLSGTLVDSTVITLWLMKTR